MDRFNLQSSDGNEMNLPDTDPNHKVETSDYGLEREDHDRRFRFPSASTYIAVVGSAALAVFFLLWFILHTGGDEASWIPAGLAASILFLVALAAREVVLRRALTRHILEKERRDYRVTDFHRKRTKSVSLEYYSSKLRSIAKRSASADSKDENAEAHIEVYQACRDYLYKVESALRSARQGSQTLFTLRAGQERALSLQKHHLLRWAAIASREWTNEAQKRIQPKEKLEAAQKALDVIDSALKIYPDEPQLLASAIAIKDHISSLRVAQWIERAERDAFKGHYRRAIERYKDALFYLSREEMSDELSAQIANHISLEVEGLREKIQEKKGADKQGADSEFEDYSFDEDIDSEEDDFSSQERRTDIN